MRLAPLAVLPLFAVLAGPASSQVPVAEEKKPLLLNGHNVVVILADDLSIDGLLQYAADPGFPAAGPTPIATPGIDALVTAGVRFENAWSAPVCSPTRALIQTGNYGFRTGIGHVIERDNLSLGANEVTLPDLLENHCPDTVYRSAAFGKWHLHLTDDCDPIARGYRYFVGSRSEVQPPYCEWPRVVCNQSGQVCPSASCPTSTTYMPEDVMQSAINWMNDQPSTGAFFAWVAPQAPYEYFHNPPATLFPNCQAPGNCLECLDPLTNSRTCFDAALCALDTKITDLLNARPNWKSNTTIILVGDNGSPNGGSGFPVGQRKATLYQGGVHVPMIIAGKAIPMDARGKSSEALVHAVDLYRTIAEITGANVPASNGIDSVDLSPIFADPENHPGVRTHVFSEVFAANPPHLAVDQAAIRDDTYKLIWDCLAGAPIGLFDLAASPQEDDNLIVGGVPPAPGTPAGDAYCDLRAELSALKPCVPVCPPGD